MIQVLSLEPVAMPSAGEYWRYTELREPFDVLADESVVPLTAGGDARRHYGPAVFGRDQGNIGLKRASIRISRPYLSRLAARLMKPPIFGLSLRALV